MNKYLALLLIVMFCCAQAMGQSGQAPNANPQTTSPQSPSGDTTKAPDLGQLDGTNYLNDSLGLSLSVPRDWVVVSAQRSTEVIEDSKKRLQVQSQGKQAQIDDSIQRSTTLLSLTKLPAGQPNNASVMLIAERIPSPDIKTGSDVIRTMERTMKGTNFTVEFQGGISTERVGNADFGVATIKNTSPYGVFMQKIYVTIRGEFAIQLFFTYLEEADLAVFDGIVKSTKFK